jgi:TonB family protein
LKDKNTHTERKKNFINLPKYTGGKKAFNEFIFSNLVYPDEALKNRIEGIVYAEYEVDSSGKISNVKIKKGIGYGCDEETIRILSLLVYEKATNRGIRVKSKMKTRIQFKLPALPVENFAKNVNINYTVTETKTSNPIQPKAYTYTINLG